MRPRAGSQTPRFVRKMLHHFLAVSTLPQRPPAVLMRPSSPCSRCGRQQSSTEITRQTPSLLRRSSLLPGALAATLSRVAGCACSKHHPHSNTPLSAPPPLEQQLQGRMRRLPHAPAWRQLLVCPSVQLQQQTLSAAAAAAHVLAGTLLQWRPAHTISQPPLDSHHQQHQQQPAPEQRERQQQQPAPEQQQQRLLSVAVVGLPNAGKSTLVNRLAGTKISGVSSKRNTTISPQLGAFTDGDTQVLLYDTPGLVEQAVRTSPLERLRAAWSTAAAADQVLFIVDAERQFRLREPALLSLAQQLAAGPPQAMLQGWRLPPCLLFLNKRDKLPPVTRATVMEQLRRQLGATLRFAAVFEGAAMLGEGVAELRRHLVQQAQPAAWVMAPGQQHAATPGELAVELVREKLYRRLNQELPYRLAITCEAARPAADGRPGLYIRVAVTVRTRLQKSVVIGRGGSVIQQYVTEPTRAELERVLGTPVNLSVRVQAPSES